MALLTLRTHASKLIPNSLLSSQLVSKLFSPSPSRTIVTGNTGATAILNDSTSNKINASKSDRSSPATLISLAERALELAHKIQNQGIPSPSFQHDTLADLPADIDGIRFELVDVSDDLLALARGAGGAFGRIQTVACTHFAEELSLHFVYRFKVAQAVPMNDMISFEDLSKKINVDQLTVIRLLRNAMTFHMFHEPKKGFVAHTQDSRLLVEDETLYDFVGCALEDLRPGANNQLEAIEKWPGSQEPNHTGYNIAFNTELPLYRYLSQYPERIRRVSALMAQVMKSGFRDAKRIAELYPWESLGQGTIIDMGGGSGHNSVALARAHSKLKFIVQDLPSVTAQGEANLPAELQGQVSFMAHDFFKDNPVKDATAFFMMNTLHTWSDKYVVQIFKQLVPSLKPGARILVCDRVVPEQGTVSDVEYKEIRSVDIYMMHSVNGRERSAEDIFGLFKETDARFKHFKSYNNSSSLYTICEAVWEP